MQDAINKCDVDLRRELYNGIILAGEGDYEGQQEAAESFGYVESAHPFAWGMLACGPTYNANICNRGGYLEELSSSLAMSNVTSRNDGKLRVGEVQSRERLGRGGAVTC